MDLCEHSSTVISVVIPCHNARSWLGETLASVLSQRGVTVEIIVIDDGSTDASPEVAAAAELAGHAIQIIRQPRSGVGRARNTGTRAARGSHIQYLDADDLLEPNTLAARIAVLEHSGADIAYCDWRVWERQRDGSFGPGALSCRILSERPDVDLLTNIWWPPGAVLYRREIVERIGLWNEDLPINQDVRFLVRAASIGATFVRVGQPGLRYRVHGEDSLSRHDSRAFLDDCYRNATQLQHEWEKNGILDAPRRGGLLRIYRYLSRAFLSADDRSLDITKRIAALRQDR